MTIRDRQVVFQLKKMLQHRYKVRNILNNSPELNIDGKGDENEREIDALSYAIDAIEFGR